MDMTQEIKSSLDEYKMRYLSDGETDFAPAKADDKVIVIPRTLEQAQRLVGATKKEALANLAHINKYVHLYEDMFLGKRYEDAPKMRYDLVAEEIYLSRGLNNRQGLTHTILELLQLLASQDPEDPLNPKKEDKRGQVQYMKLHRGRLRRILFSNPFLQIFSSNGQISDDDKWKNWQEQYNKLNCIHTEKVNEIVRISDEDLEYLKKHFSFGTSSTFGNFEKTVNLLRSWLIDFNSERQWTTLFLFPFGINAIYQELQLKNSNNIKSTNFNNGIMGGQGCLIYSMLLRAYAYDHAVSPSKVATYQEHNVGKSLVKRFFNHDAVDNYAAILNHCAQDHDETQFLKVVQEASKTLDPNKENLYKKAVEMGKSMEQPVAAPSTMNEREKSTFMPYIYLPRYTILRDDFENILKCQLNKQDLFIALGRIAILNLMLFKLEQEQKIRIAYGKYKHDQALAEGGESFDDKDFSTDHCDIEMPVCAPGSDLGSFSHSKLLENERMLMLGQDAYTRLRSELFLDHTVPFLKKQASLNEDEANLVKTIFCAAFDIKEEKLNKDKDNQWDFTNCSTITDSMVRVIQARPTQLTNLHLRMGKECGLIVETNRGKPHYEMSDDLLRTLIMAVLGDKDYMKLSDFLDILKARYHLIIGPGKTDADQSREQRENSTSNDNFEKNETQLKLQLHRLDMLIYLSDYCEYVKKP